MNNLAEKLYTILFPAFLGAAIVLLMLGFRVSDLEQQVRERPPVVVFDLPNLVASLPMDISDEELERKIQIAHANASLLADQGYIVINAESVWQAHDSFYLGVSRED